MAVVASVFAWRVAHGAPAWSVRTEPSPRNENGWRGGGDILGIPAGGLSYVDKRW